MLAASCATTGTPETTVATTSPPPVSTVPGGDDVVVMSGSVEIPAAAAFGDPGFHQPLALSGRVSDSAAGLKGQLLVRLVDAGRPDQVCDREHPLSGCATVDWSDFEDRPGVPPGGVFDNRLSIVLGSGPVDLFLSESGGLADVPDEYSPT